MGKSNRIRTLRANTVRNMPAKKTVKKGMPSWVITTITITITVALLLGVVAMVLNANGVFGRMNTVVESDNFKFDANMMSYMFNNQYMNIVTNYGSSGYISLNPQKPLKDQQFGSSSYLDTYIFGEFKGTWYDFIVNQTVESAESILTYCEYAKKHNIALDADDYKEIDAAIAEHKTYAENAASFDSYIAYYYGAGVTERDMRKCMEYSMLAEKAMEEIEADIDESITTEDINNRYNESKTDYDVVDYVYYTFNVSYQAVAEEVLKKSDPTDAEIQAKAAEILTEYKKQIAEAKEKAKKAEQCKDADEFMAYILGLVAEESTHSTYLGKTIKDDIKYKESGLTETQINDYFIEQIEADVLEEFLAGKEEVEDAVTIPKDDDGKATVETVTAYGKTVKVGFAEILNSVKSTVFTRLESVKKTYTVEKATASKDSETKEYDAFSKWAFKTDKDGTAAAKGDKKFIEEGAKADITSVADAKNKYSYNTVYFITEAQRKDVERSKNLSYITFTTETAAKDAIKSFTDKGTFTVEEFKKLAETNKLTVSSRTDYVKGTFGLSDFDTWAYGEDTKAKSITATPIKQSSTAYIVGFMEGEGTELWEISVKNALFSERAKAKNEEVEKEFKVTNNGNAAKSINSISESIFVN